MRNLVVAAGLALCSSGAMAADFGIGVSAKSEDGVVYVPIDISDSVRLEPSIRYLKDESTQGSFTSETELLELGLGVFGLSKVTPAAHIYYGARITYFDVKTDSGFSEATQDGYGVAPTFGVEYVFGERFSLGGEAAYVFQDIDREEDGFDAGDRKDQGTQTRLIFRYMF